MVLRNIWPIWVLFQYNDAILTKRISIVNIRLSQDHPYFIIVIPIYRTILYILRQFIGFLHEILIMSLGLLRVSVAVVVAFFICWAPFHAQRLMTALIPDEKWSTEPKLHEIQTALFYISGRIIVSPYSWWYEALGC